MKASLLSVLLFVFVFAAGTAYSQTPEKKNNEQPNVPKSIADSVSSTLSSAEGDLLGLAEAMPEDKYSFVPDRGDFQGVRSFGEQIKHVACAQFAFFNEFEGKKPPDDCEKGGRDPARTKSQLVTYLKDSFDYGNRVLATLTANNALDPIEGRYAGPNTKLGISVVAVWHLTDHYGDRKSVV